MSGENGVAVLSPWISVPPCLLFAEVLLSFKMG
jgi:hypothetical protein